MSRTGTFFPTTEEVVGTAPLRIRRVVRWGECDPAGIVYTPRFLDYAVSAHEAFVSLMLDGPLHRMKGALGVDFPVRGVELDFRAPLALDAPFEMELRAGAIRNRSYDLHIRALGRDGVLAFVARLSPVTVDPRNRAAVALPEQLRNRIAAYAAAHPLKEED